LILNESIPFAITDRKDPVQRFFTAGYNLMQIVLSTVVSRKT